MFFFRSHERRQLIGDTNVSHTRAPPKGGLDGNHPIYSIRGVK